MVHAVFELFAWFEFHCAGGRKDYCRAGVDVAGFPCFGVLYLESAESAEVDVIAGDECLGENLGEAVDEEQSR